MIEIARRQNRSFLPAPIPIPVPVRRFLMAESKGKRTVVCLSSSSDEEDNDVESQDDQVFQVIESDGSPDIHDIPDDTDDEEESDDPNDDEEDNNNDGDESGFDKIIRFLRENRELGSLKLKDCKVYLQAYGLRVTGTKSVCLQRIKEHWRLKDGSGEVFYPRPSFSINCTGDVCKGDVVLFRQKVYEKLDNVFRHGRVLGKRIIAGRVVKESYGTAKQQHTFTVEVLWSRGIKKLPPLYPLLIKGRNLYRMRTFRQCWHNEAERQKVLAEKHRRGDAARLERAMKKTKKWPSDKGKKRQREFPSEGRSKMRKNSESKKGRYHFDRLQRTTNQGYRGYGDHQQKDFRASVHFKGCSTSKHPSFPTGSDPPPIHRQYQLRSQQAGAPYHCLRQDWSTDPTMRDYRDNRQKDSMFRESEHLKGYQTFTSPCTIEDPSFRTCSDPPQFHHQYQLRSQQRSVLHPCLREDGSANLTITDFLLKLLWMHLLYLHLGIIVLTVVIISIMLL